MMERSGDATALLGMEGFVVLSMDQIEGEWWLLVETTAKRGGLPGLRGPGDRPWTEHGPGAGPAERGQPVRLVWRKRRWICPDPDCERKSFTEQSELVEGSLTRAGPGRDLPGGRRGGHTVAEQARRFGVGWTTAMGAVRDHGRPLVEDPRRLHGVRALGIDEHKMLAAGPGHHTVYATQLVDIDRGLLFDVVPGRSARRRCPTGSTSAPGTGVTTSTSSPSIPTAGYHKALVSSCPGHHHRRPLPRRQVGQRRGRRRPAPGPTRDPRAPGPQGRPPLWRPPADDPGLRAPLRPPGGPAHRGPAPWRPLRRGGRGHPGARSSSGGSTRQESRAGRTSAPRRFYEHAQTPACPRSSGWPRTIRRWEPEILTFFTTRRTNAGSEAMNLITEKLRRIAHGIRNFENYRLRLLLHSGVQWNTPPTARIRGRHPRLVA